MLAYAQDAMETDKPWERWEYLAIECYREWQQCEGHPAWITKNDYRRKALTININGFEVPEPVREPLPGCKYYFPWIAARDLVEVAIWTNHSMDDRLLDLGIIHLTREAAEIHAKALLSFTQKP